MARPEPDVASPPILELRGVSKGFPNVQALDDVSLELHAGEVLALIGENGAGKSTLLRILSGDYQPDAGELLLDGRPVTFPTPRAAHAHGVRVIYQEPEIAGTVSVAENLYIGELPTRLGRFVDQRRLTASVRELLDRSGFGDEIDPRSLGDALSPAQRQLVEILKALKGDLRVLALDEPTSSLTAQEVARLMAIVRRMRTEGVALAYVSHRIREILQLADRVAVLRDGKLVAVRGAHETSEGELVQLMVGRPVVSVFAHQSHATTEPVLQVRGLTTAWLKGVDLAVHRGEVVGLAGLIGAGRSELARALFGLVPVTGGRVTINGQALAFRGPREAIAYGVGLAPEDRKRDGLFLPRNVRENITISVLPTLRRLRVVRARQERRMALRLIDRLRIRTPSPEQEVSTLSGGNQQKVVLARWLAQRPKLLILDEPTRGIDVGAKAEIYALIHELASEGMAILFISSELPEVLGVSDRVVVMQNGRVTGELAASGATEASVLALAMAEHLSPAAEVSVPAQG
jgi:L-arabinose transport system ATP-binding protein